MISAIIMTTLCIGLGLLYIRLLPRKTDKAEWAYNKTVILNNKKPTLLEKPSPISKPKLTAKTAPTPNLSDSHVAIKRRKLMSDRNRFSILASKASGTARAHALKQCAIYNLRLNSPHCTITDMAEFKRRKNA